MASSLSTMFPMRGDLANCKVVHLQIYPQGSSAPVVVGGVGLASVAYSTTGTFLITMTHAYKRLRGKQATAQLASAADIVPQFGTVSNIGTSTPPTIVLRLNAGATPTNVSADANNCIDVTLAFDDSAAVDVS